jgi:hypothetical protein
MLNPDLLPSFNLNPSLEKRVSRRHASFRTARFRFRPCLSGKLGINYKIKSYNSNCGRFPGRGGRPFKRGMTTPAPDIRSVLISSDCASWISSLNRDKAARMRRRQTPHLVDTFAVAIADGLTIQRPMAQDDMVKVLKPSSVVSVLSRTTSLALTGGCLFINQRIAALCLL